MSRKPFTCRKYGGDDRYSWAIFRYGCLYMSGMDRNEAQWRVKKLNEEHKS